MPVCYQHQALDTRQTWRRALGCSSAHPIFTMAGGGSGLPYRKSNFPQHALESSLYPGFYSASATQCQADPRSFFQAGSWRPRSTRALNPTPLKTQTCIARIGVDIDLKGSVHLHLRGHHVWLLGTVVQRATEILDDSLSENPWL